jgi:hypothetical protein
MQGSDIASDGTGTFSSENGGIIKAFGNAIVGSGNAPVTYQQNKTHFDCYLASSRDEKVPSSVTALKGGFAYNNFDTNSALMYEYNVESAEDAMETVKRFAGRVQGGDFKWEFTDADNASYDVNAALKSALKNYKGTLVSTNVGDVIEKEPTTNPDDSGNGSNQGGSGEVTPTPDGAIVHNFHESGKESSFFNISGNLSTIKGTVEYKGMTLTQCLKIESKTTLTFNLTQAKKLTLVFNKNNGGKSIKIDDVSHTIPSDGILIVELEVGTHSFKRDGSELHLYYMMLE